MAGRRCKHCSIGYRKGKRTPSPDTAPAPSPETARWLATNDPPSASQEEEFRRIRVDGVKRLAELETIIEELQQTLEGVVAERDALKWKVEHHRLVLNPVRRLPADVLREIFLFACARRTEYPSHFYLIRPTLLAAVCRSWNDITVTFPQLWRQCRVLVPQSLSDSWARPVDYEEMDEPNDIQVGTATAISRAALCPLWIDLHLGNRFSDAAPSYILLLCIANRIQRIRICSCDLEMCDWPEFHLFTRRLTSLESMDLCVTGFCRVQRIPAFSPPRTLRHLIITPYEVLSNPVVDLNWSHLESLVLRARLHIHPEDALARSTLVILAKVHNLRHLTFSDDCEVGSVAVEGELRTIDGLITMAHLTDLVIESCTPFLDDVMATISTPSLERLVIRGGSREIWPRVQAMLQKSGCTLRHLTLQSVGKDDVVDNIDAVHSLIHQCGLLRELCLLDIHADTHCVTQLPSSSLEPLSQLRVLALDISRVHGFCATTQITVAEGILAFLESRRRPADSGAGAASHVDLETFTLHAPIKEVFDFTEGQHQRIKALRASGLLFYMCRCTAKDRRLYD